MTASDPTPSPPRGGPSGSVLVIAGIVLAVGAAGAWFLLGSRGAGTPDDPIPANPGVPGASYVAPTRMDPAKASLVAEPTGMRLDVVLSGTAPGDTIHARLRDTRQDPRRPTIFLDRGTPPTAVGRLEVTASETGAAGETRLSVRIPMAVDAVTVIDLRASRRWEGFEVAAPATR
ncbi:MAG: hypothetical protein JNM10_00535 [Planctomycetia bacterium]|nr:hypothetical protein [Planctomycetia bacterium]